jgi:hypothetical protein
VQFENSIMVTSVQDIDFKAADYSDSSGMNNAGKRADGIIQ